MKFLLVLSLLLAILFILLGVMEGDLFSPFVYAVLASGFLVSGAVLGSALYVGYHVKRNSAMQREIMRRIVGARVSKPYSIEDVLD